MQLTKPVEANLIYANGWNQRKYKLLFMLDAQGKDGKLIKAPARTIAEYSGVGINSVRAALSRWMTFRRPYVKRELSRYGDCYYYSLSARGQSWLEWARQHLPVEDIENEVAEYQKEAGLLED